MTAVHIIASMDRGGRERQLALICSRSSGIENRIIYYHHSPESYISQYGLQDLAVHVSRKGFLVRVAGTLKTCRDFKAECVAVWGPLETVIGMIVSVILGIPMVNFSIRHGIRRKTFSHYLRLVLLHMSRYIVANSVAGLKANNLSGGIVLYNGIEIPEKVSSADEKKALRIQRFGSSKTVFVSVANLVPYKDYFTVLKALSEVKKHGREFFYIIIGDGPNRKVIVDLIKELELEDDVLMTGSISNVNDYLDLSDVMIHSSLGEGCSNAILEGMMHGLPIIATNVGGTPELVNENNSCLFEFEDWRALQKHIEKLISDKQMLADMGNESRKIIQSKFGIGLMLEKYEDIISSIIDKDKARLTDLETQIG